MRAPVKARGSDPDLIHLADGVDLYSVLAKHPHCLDCDTGSGGFAVGTLLAWYGESLHTGT